MAGRIQEAWTVFWHGECSFERRFQGMADELMQLMIQQSDSMEKLNAWAARMAKREKRAMIELNELLETPEVAPGPTIVHGQGVAIGAAPQTKYDRIRARRGGLVAPQGTGPAPPEPETQELNDGIRREEAS
jgi:hypothetical protein